MVVKPGNKVIMIQVDEKLHGEFRRVCKERGLKLQGGLELAMVNEIEVAAGRNPRAVQGSAEKDRVLGEWLEKSARGAEDVE